MHTRLITSGLILVATVVVIILVVAGQPISTIDVEGSPVDNPVQFFEEHSEKPNEAPRTALGNEGRKELGELEKPYLVTNGVKHTVPLEDIVSGGPPKDGIPSIDRPTFTTTSEGDEFLDDGGLGIAVSFNGVDRFYPFQILVWHEIVNDIVGGVPIVVTYCPLCHTGIVFDPVIEGAHTTFGTSGKLWNSNLVMYDRATNSYWSQVLGEGIVGERAGVKLTLLPHHNMTWGDWKVEHTTGEVLSRDTGFFRDYTNDPYGDYYTNQSILFPIDYRDQRLHPKAVVYGIEIDGTFKAYPEGELSKKERTSDRVADVTIDIVYNKDNTSVIFRNAETNKEIIPVFGFWFSWVSVHPQTELFSAA